MYGQEVTVYTDHSAVSSVLQKPGASGKHARWWLKVHGSSVKNVTIGYRPGHEISRAEALSCSPVGLVPDNMDSGPVTVASVQASDMLPDLLQQDSHVEG